MNPLLPGTRLGLLRAVVSRVEGYVVKVTYPCLKTEGGGDLESGWLPVLAPLDASAPVMPALQDTVVIGFFNGAHSSAIVLGKLVPGTEPPGT